MQLKLQSVLVPVRQTIASIGDAINDEATGEERFISAAAVVLGVMVVAAFAMLMSMV